MFSTWTSATAVLRRIGIALMLIAVVVLTSSGLAYAQAAPAAQAPAAAPAPQARVFTGDVGLMFNIIKPDKTADFEMVVGKLKEALAKSDDPVHKQMAQGWRVLKNPEPIQGGNYLYVFLVDPVVKDADYTVSRVLAKAFPAEVQELFKVYSACFAGGVTLQNYTTLVNMK
ncbi:MAG: hypothetical protein MUE61_02725 [Vicinamibacterales bacterium]|jgi:hypothetical protein|nr:hypothetical protein [Vicinamibacterales bacterium]